MLRLMISDKILSEVETQVTRSRVGGAIFAIEGLKEASKAMAFVPERTHLATRDEAIKIAEYYPAGLKVGSFVSVNARFATAAYPSAWD